MNEQLAEEIVAKVRGMDIPMVGFAPVDLWDSDEVKSIPASKRPKSLYGGARTAIVMGMPVHPPVIDTAPSNWYRELYKTVNSILDHSAYRLATWLGENGYPSVYIPRDGYVSLDYLIEGGEVRFSHRHAAFLAGLGTFGVNNLILTPEYGPRVRFTTVLTSADLPGPSGKMEQLCTRCMKCVKSCPANAIPGDDYPVGMTDKNACAQRNDMQKKKGTAPCGICIKVCPVGRDRKLYAMK